MPLPPNAVYGFATVCYTTTRVHCQRAQCGHILLFDLLTRCMNRRQFLAGLAGVSALPFAARAFAMPRTMIDELQGEATDQNATTSYIFSQMIKHAEQGGWQKQPIGELMGNLGMLLLGTKYEGGTLEGPGPEVCRANLTGLDCVTFFENVLCMARILKKGTPTFDAFMRELTYTRYRGGKLTDYTSRLHYTADWISDNEQKGVIKDLTMEMGGEPFPLHVNFMSEHPQYYPALKDAPELVKTMATIEKDINARQLYYIPQKDIKKAQKLFRTGDIVAVATDKQGLDYAHTGMIVVDKKNKARFLHASLQKKKVYYDTELYKYVQSVKSHIGVSIVRPLDIA